MRKEELVVKSELFDAESLDFYTRHNLSMLDEHGKDSELYKK
jgi:hypothetical protein